MPDHVRLTPAERCVLQRHTRGDSAKKIALDVRRSESTVRWHLKQLHRKTGAHNGVELARWAQLHDACCLDGLLAGDAPTSRAPQ